MTNYNFLPKGLKSNLGWYRRNLPHFDGGEIPQFLTFRLFDSLPQSVLQRFREEAKHLGEKGEAHFRRNIEKYLDTGYGACFLEQPEVARIVADSFKFHDGSKYALDAWVIMPNHTHILATPYPDVELSEIAHSIKSYTAMKPISCSDAQVSFGNTSRLTVILEIPDITGTSLGTLKTTQ